MLFISITKSTPRYSSTQILTGGIKLQSHSYRANNNNNRSLATQIFKNYRPTRKDLSDFSVYSNRNYTKAIDTSQNIYNNRFILVERTRRFHSYSNNRNCSQKMSSSVDLESRQQTLDYLNSWGLSLKLTTSGVSIPDESGNQIKLNSEDNDQKVEEDLEISENFKELSDHLNSLSNQVQSFVFANFMSSLLAGSDNESDEAIDLPIVLGKRKVENENDDHLNWILSKLGLNLDFKNVKIIDRLKQSKSSDIKGLSTSTNQLQNETGSLKIIESLIKLHQKNPNSNQQKISEVSNDGNKDEDKDDFYSIVNALNKLKREDLIHFEINIDKSHFKNKKEKEDLEGNEDELDFSNKDGSSNRTICVLIGRIEDFYLGLISYRITT